MAQERLLNHADAEQIASALETLATGSHGTNDGDVGGLPSHVDGARLVAAIRKLAEYLDACFDGKVDTETGKGLSANDFSDTYKTKLDGIESGAEVNVQSDWGQTVTTSDDYVKNKPTLGTAAAKDATSIIAEDGEDLIESGAVYTGLAAKISSTEKGAASGVAELDSTGRVPSSQLPSYVDDILEYADATLFPAEGETGKIYVALDTNKMYRWSGTGYVEVPESLALGETSSTAYAGNKGKANADAIAAMLDGSTIDSFGDVETALAGKVDTETGKGLSSEDYTLTEKAKLAGIESGAEVNAVTSVAGKTGDVTLTGADVGLGNVGNYKAVSTDANQDLTETEKANARANIGAGASSFSGDYNDLSNKPTLGTASALNVASSGDASSGEVVKGDDSRLTDARQASDVPSWAKASTKPSYTISEIGNAGAAASKAVDSSISAGSSSTDLPTSAAVASFVEGKGYRTASGNWYATSSTTASTADKVVTCSGFALETGAIISILFTTANTANAPTININSTGANALYYGASATSSSNPCKWGANSVLTVMYDGTYYRVVSIEPGLGGGGAGQTVTTRTLSASGWSNGVYSLTSYYANASYDIFVSAYSGMTNAQKSAYAAAQMVGSATENKITACGTVPTIDIPVMVVAFPK